MSYIPARDGVVSLVNSSLVPLISGGNFTGVQEDVTQYASISVSIITDQDSVTDGLKMQFSVDGVNWDKSKPHTIKANDNHNFLLTCLAQYFRVVFDNGTTAQGMFRLQCIFHKSKNKEISVRLDDEIQSDDFTSLTRTIIVGASDGGEHFENVSVDAQKNLSVNVREPASAFGEVSTVEKVPVVQINFVYNVNSDIVNSPTTGAATVTQDTSNIVLSTGAAINSKADVSSRKYLKTRPGQGSNITFSALFSAGVAGSKQFGGGGTDFNGHYFGFDGAVFGVLRLDDSVFNWTPQTAWNVDAMDGTGPSGMILNILFGNIYKIVFQWLGYGAIKYYIESQITGVFTLVHVAQFANTSLTPNVRLPSFPTHFHVENTTNTTDIVLRSSSSAAFIEGQVVLLGPRNSASNTKSGVGTTTTNIVTIRNKSNFQSLINYTSVYISFLSFAVDGNKPAFVHLILDGVLGGTPTYNDIDTNNSVVEFNTDGTTVTGGKVLATISLDKFGSELVRLRRLELDVTPGHTLTVAVQATSGSTDALGSISWIEDI